MASITIHPGVARPVPVSISGCMSWLHQAPGRVGVLMVGTVGVDALGTYRPWRDLAGSLAAAGNPALRLTLPGTGTAPEPDGLPDMVARWLDAISLAAYWMRRSLMLDEVVPCGLAFGALLVACASSRDGGTARSILLAPPASGRQFLRAEQARARIAGFRMDGCPERLELPSLTLHQSAVRDVEALSLQDLACSPARRILLMTRGDVASAAGIASALRCQDGVVEAEAFPGYDALSAEAYFSKRPEAAWNRVTSWVGNGWAGQVVAFPRTAAGDMTDPAWYERPVSIPARDGTTLAGMYTGPACGKLSKGLAVVVVSSGANPNAGYGRSAAFLCRHLTGIGLWSLRFDFSGVGDSDGHEEMDVARLFGPADVAEVHAVIEWMSRQGHARVVLVGICSGAFQAMQAALADRRVEGLVLANQLFYGSWHGGGLTGWQRRRNAAASRAIRRGEAAADRPIEPSPAAGRSSWRRDLFRTGLRAGMQIEEAAAHLGRRAGLGTARRRFRALSKRRVRTLVLAGETDVAMQLLDAEFGPGASALSRIDGIELRVAPCFDHSLGMVDAQRWVASEVERFLSPARTGTH